MYKEIKGYEIRVVRPNMSGDNELRDIFFEESSELVVQLEQDILKLEENKEDEELINGVFRNVHSIKGSAAFVGFDNISTFAHKMESILDLVRKGTLLIDSELVNVLLKGLDVIKKMLGNPEEDTSEDVNVKEALKGFRNYLSDYEEGVQKEGITNVIQKKEKYYRIILNFNKDIFEIGIDPLILIDELISKGELIECNINTSEVPDIYKMDPYLLYMTANMIIKSERPKKEIEDVFIFVIKDNKIVIEEISEAEVKAGDKKIGEILVEKGIIKEEDIEEVLNKQQKIGELLIQEGKVTPAQIEKIAKDQQESRKIKESTTIRVDTQKLDNLINLVGELVINQARVAQIASKKEKINSVELSATAESLDRITRDIQESIMRARMIPIESTFNQFHRMVRDLSMEKGKEIILNIKGKETELDKTLVELISDPLKHMIRNSIDHGIETKEERKKKGKREEGTITLNAYHEAGNIVIEVSDDGKGLDKEKILEKAREKGLVSKERELSEDEIYKLIFLPGFSTAEEVSEISGRGVGMDVVKNNIGRLRGNIEIYSKEGEGTIFKIILPLTLAIIDGMLVKIGEELYIVPLLTIVESIRPKEIEVKHVNQESEVINVRGEYIPLVRLHELFGIETEHKDPSKALVIIVSSGKSKVCLLVDDIIGQQQAVIKSLEENYKEIKGLSGATILGDGTVAMILDINAIIKIASN